MIEFSMCSEVGERLHNEDHIGMFQMEEHFCFVLADGLGGHGKGEVASETAVHKAVEVFAAEKGNQEDYLNQAFCAAQAEILNVQKVSFENADMKTTMVILQIEGSIIRWGHIGDSRLYYFKNKKLERRTLDHSVPQILVASGEIREKEIRHHPDRNRLLKVLGGPEKQPRFEKSEPVGMEQGQVFLLCSDGFWEWIDEKKMTQCLKRSKTPKEWLLRMQEIILKNGSGKGMDNYSAIAVFINI